jgi:hypothetical protein
MKSGWDRAAARLFGAWALGWVMGLASLFLYVAGYGEWSIAIVAVAVGFGIALAVGSYLSSSREKDNRDEPDGKHPAR